MTGNQEKEVWIIEGIKGPATRYKKKHHNIEIWNSLAMGSDRLMGRNTIHGNKNMGAFSTTTKCTLQIGMSRKHGLLLFLTLIFHSSFVFAFPSPHFHLIYYSVAFVVQLHMPIKYLDNDFQILGFLFIIFSLWSWYNQ